MEALTKMKLNCTKMNKLQLHNDYREFYQDFYDDFRDMKSNKPQIIGGTLHTRRQHPQNVSISDKKWPIVYHFTFLSSAIELPEKTQLRSRPM